MAEGFAEYPPRTAIPNLVLHESTIRDKVDATKIADKWLSTLLTSISVKDAAALENLFFSEAWWRDLVALSWTITSKNGPPLIAKLLLESEATIEQVSLVSTSPLAPQLMDMGPMTIIQFGFSFLTQHASGRGVVRLGNDGPDSWKAWTASTQLEELLNQPASNAPVTTNGSNGHAEEDEHLQVVIVGAGQSGVMLGAWLKELGIKYLILDKQPRAGEAWRARYASVKSHTPIYTDHFPFLQFPSNWPKWLERDALADWIEHYSAIMGLNVVPNAAVSSVNRDIGTGTYTINATINGTQQKTYKTTHFVLATGVFPPIPFVPEFPGRDLFHGQLYHTVQGRAHMTLPRISSTTAHGA
ncbi:hypothetical protein NQ176_g4746 [Zarea fungicola]|uniref:Uncharacterized protein n=1 Tax=Zarea fungicola TaxID=93591 RepID=A0ACC1NE56_9HYPO|nr:hypothetical protein NQ176_g4746 [Lecanicillium fungicola]